MYIPIYQGLTVAAVANIHPCAMRQMVVEYSPVLYHRFDHRDHSFLLVEKWVFLRVSDRVSPL